MSGVSTEVGEDTGKIHLGTSLSRLKKQTLGLQGDAAALAALTALPASTVGSLPLRFILRNPITAPMRGTARIAEGELGYRVPITSDDEAARAPTSSGCMVWGPV